MTITPAASVRRLQECKMEKCCIKPNRRVRAIEQTVNKLNSLVTSVVGKETAVDFASKQRELLAQFEDKEKCCVLLSPSKNSVEGVTKT